MKQMEDKHLFSGTSCISYILIFLYFKQENAAELKETENPASKKRKRKQKFKKEVTELVRHVFVLLGTSSSSQTLQKLCRSENALI